MKIPLESETVKGGQQTGEPALCKPETKKVYERGEPLLLERGEAASCGRNVQNHQKKPEQIQQLRRVVHNEKGKGCLNGKPDTVSRPLYVQKRAKKGQYLWSGGGNQGGPKGTFVGRGKDWVHSQSDKSAQTTQRGTQQRKNWGGDKPYDARCQDRSERRLRGVGVGWTRKTLSR